MNRFFRGTLGFVVGLTLAASAQTTKFGTSFEGQVWAIEPDAVYVTGHDSTAVRVPLNATFLLNGSPVSATSLKQGGTVTVVYPDNDLEVVAGPLPPTATNEYFHRTIRRGPDVIDQNYVNGVWVDQ
jgi:hypothetical protein